MREFCGSTSSGGGATDCFAITLDSTVRRSIMIEHNLKFRTRIWPVFRASCSTTENRSVMVGYELNVLLSRTASPYRSLELVRRCANMVVGSGGVVKGIANHGIRPLGYKIRKNNESHTDAHYIAMQADMNPKVIGVKVYNMAAGNSVTSSHFKHLFLP